jgi:predicted AlkP superfamily phosphohydrolase/phosphomutase
VGAEVLLVGLDAADHALVERSIATGALPTLAHLQRHGVRGALAPLYGLGDDAAWSSFSTATMPSRHGRYYHARLGPDGTSLVHTTRADTAMPPFWDALARAGKQVAVIDVPKSPLGDDRAVVVADWMPHGGDEPRVCFSAAARARGLHDELARDPSFDCDRALTSAKQRARFRDRLAQRARDRTDVVCSLLVDDDWDLVITTFAEPHCVGHACWRDADVVERVYTHVDAQLARLIDAAGPATMVVAFSLIGMGANYSGTHLLPALLERLPAAAPRPYTVLPLDLRTSGIRIAREYDSSDTRRELRAFLTGLRDPATGEALVREVAFVDEVDPGPAAGDFVDVLVEWASARPITAAQVDGSGVVRRRPRRDRPGNHHGGGWFVAAGPGVAPGLLDHPYPIVDVGPTVAAWFGVGLDGVDGAPIAALTGGV